MNICLNCSSSSTTFDGKVGELYCADCGLIIEDNMIEENPSTFNTIGEQTRELPSAGIRKLGSVVGKGKGKVGSRLRKAQTFHDKTPFERTLSIGLSYCNLTLSEFNSSFRIKEEVASNYISAIKGAKLRGANYEERAGAIVFFTLKDNNISISLDDVANAAGCKKERLSKYARELAAFFERPYVLHRRNVRSELEKYVNNILKGDIKFYSNCFDVAEYLQRVYEEHSFPITKSFFCTAIYIANMLNKRGLTQGRVCEGTGVSEVSLRNNLAKVLNVVGIPNRHFLEGMTIDEFTNGVRNG
tara:strand:+ start:3243 stop:4145 length:903 start_codon:yes stop_codon:yes gene_type:complete